ncbi:DUF4258 domain-containing protein, partial [Anaerolineae bacterium CFX9]|nr:DUF4258 domain-containing protein [Anaerolineae bacterium CFX9]
MAFPTKKRGNKIRGCHPIWNVCVRSSAKKPILLTDHASSRAVSRAITSYDIEAVIDNGEVIEDYPEDK